jgi:hypothetical protein
MFSSSPKKSVPYSVSYVVAKQSGFTVRKEAGAAPKRSREVAARDTVTWQRRKMWHPLDRRDIASMLVPETGWHHGTQ